jgi:integrase
MSDLTLVAGAKTARRLQRPTLYPADLARIVGADESAYGYRAHRNHAVVALFCFSGLRADEIASLRRAQALTDEALGRLTIEVVRTGRFLRLPIPEPAATPLLALLRGYRWSHSGGPGHIFRRNQATDQPLTLQALRAIVLGRCREVGLPWITASDLRAAFAYWLRLQGLSDHEATAVLGLSRVRSLDRLLVRHKALDAQRQVEEVRLAGLEHLPHRARSTRRLRGHANDSGN